MNRSQFRAPALCVALLLMASLGGCAVKVTEQQFLSGRKSPLISDQIQRHALELPLPDGAADERLRGWHLRHPAPKATLIYFYGNGDQLWANARHLHQLAQTLEADVIAYDYRGSGASDGSKRFANLRSDALRIYDALPPAAAARPVLVMGYSMGSVPAIHLAAQRPVAGLAVLAGVSSFEDVLPGLTAGIPWYAKPFVRLDFDPAFSQKPQPKEELVAVKAPTFILHGDADQQLPVVSGDELAKASKAAWTRYLRVAGLGHANPPVFSGEGLAAMKAWAQAVQGG